MANALLEALKAFSTSRWWEIGTSQDQERKKRGKPADFQKACAERHEEMRKVYESAMSQDSEQRWLRKVSSDGTSADKVASLTMLVQLCPVFSTNYIKALLAMAARTTRSDSTMAIDALKELFHDTLLPDRKLKTLDQMDPVSSKGLKKSTYTEICVVCFFEDYLKTAYAAFVQIVAAAGHNQVVFIKNRAVRTAYELLSAKPEQEKALLAMLINKLGDSSSKVSSNVAWCIKELLKEHPGMKSPVLKEVEAFVARPNITQSSKYSALLLLSEVTLNRKDGEVASQMVRLFVAQLELALRRPKLSKKEFQRRKKGWAPKRKKKEPLREEDNRLVRTLINGIRRAMPYLDGMSGTPLQEEAINALYKVCHTVAAFSTRVSILGLLYRAHRSGDPPDRFYRLLYEQLGNFDFFTSSHSWQAFMLLQKCVPDDSSCSRGAAIARRLLQLGVGTEPMVTVAALGVMRDLFAARRIEIQPLLHSIDSKVAVPEEEGLAAEEEHFVDDDVAQASAQKSEERGYDPLHREPRFARARDTPFWELQALSSHVHPSVAHYAQKLVHSEVYQDLPSKPFDTFSISELLEQFAYHSRAKRDRMTGKKETAKPVTMNSDTFLKRKSVQPHQRFFKSYFSDPTVRKATEQKKKARTKDLDDVDEEDVQENQVDEFFDEYLKGELKDVGDADEDEDDDDDDDEEEEDDDAGEDDGGEGTSEESEAGMFCDADADEEDVVKELKGKKEPSRKKLKELKKKRKESSMFASIEDYQQLLDQDDLT
ncbi:unnamed protein product [Durusdinium trenchii]|uniref:Uncharacterized protein C4F10.09c n=2 Tax=Durusdinium trenchii TaxID=1381693 RepID=A0ABP0LTS5_9DINO